MKKQELVTEIEDLLISINNHFVDVENNARIPNIELDVISSKVSKLHEKIAVFKFLNENEGSFKNEKIDIESNKLNKIEELKSKAFDVSPSIGYKLVGNAVPPLLAYHLAKKIETNWEFYFN